MQCLGNFWPFLVEFYNFGHKMVKNCLYNTIYLIEIINQKPGQKLPILRVRTMITQNLMPRLSLRARTMITHILRPRMSWRAHTGDLIIACFFIFVLTYVFGSSSIWTCQILNIKYLLLFSAARRSGKIETNIQNSKFDTSKSMGST